MTQPKALELADAISGWADASNISRQTCNQAAFELRRLHLVEQAATTFKDECAALMRERESLHALNEELELRHENVSKMLKNANRLKIEAYAAELKADCDLFASQRDASNRRIEELTDENAELSRTLSLQAGVMRKLMGEHEALIKGAGGSVGRITGIREIHGVRAAIAKGEK